MSTAPTLTGCIVRLTKMLSKYPTGLRASHVRRALESHGFSEHQIDRARDAIATTRGQGRSGTWRLRPLHERDQRPHRPPRIGTVKRVRQDMDMQANGKHEAPARRPIPHCSCCGTRIGNRAEGEPMLCHKPGCREAA